MLAIVILANNIYISSRDLESGSLLIPLCINIWLSLLKLSVLLEVKVFTFQVLVPFFDMSLNEIGLKIHLVISCLIR